MPYKFRDKEKLNIHERREIWAICAGYHKRRAELWRAKHRPEVLARYELENRAIEEALEEVCGGESDEVKELFLQALAERRGHKWSPLCLLMSHNAFYERKYRIQKLIAQKLDMI